MPRSKSHMFYYSPNVLAENEQLVGWEGFKPWAIPTTEFTFCTTEFLQTIKLGKTKVNIITSSWELCEQIGAHLLTGSGGKYALLSMHWSVSGCQWGRYPAESRHPIGWLVDRECHPSHNSRIKLYQWSASWGKSRLAGKVYQHSSNKL